MRLIADHAHESAIRSDLRAPHWSLDCSDEARVRKLGIEDFACLSPNVSTIKRNRRQRQGCHASRPVDADPFNQPCGSYSHCTIVADAADVP